MSEDDTQPNQSQRALTEADADAIAEAILRRASRKLTFYTGKGVLALAWKGMWLAILALAAYGYLSDHPWLRH